MKKLLILLVVAAVAWYGYQGWQSGRNEEKMSEGGGGETQEVMEKNWWEGGGVATATLNDVRGGEGSGEGYVLRDSDGLRHRVEAVLSDPEEGQFYEGWLVDPSPELKFFSTGEMVKDESGKYVLEYSSTVAWEGYDQVVITSESVRDETPEEHVLEGVLGEVVMGKGYTLEQVAQHAEKDDCWMVIEDKVYDVTQYVAGGLHPGKLAILQGCGKDATEMFNNRPNGSGAHSERAREFLPNFEIGDLI